MPNPIQKNSPILTVKMHRAHLEGYPSGDIALNLRVQERGGQTRRTWLGRRDEWLYQRPWQQPRPFTRLRFHFADDAPVFADGQREQFTRIPIPDCHQWPSQGLHSSHQVAIRPFDGPENGSRTAVMNLSIAWFLSSNLRDVISYVCEELARHVYSYSLRILQVLLEGASARSPEQLSPSFGIPALLMPTPTLRTLLNALAKAWFAFLMRPGSSWHYPDFLHAHFGAWSLDAERGMWYSYDIWPDLMYGYLGRAAGFSASELEMETGLEDASGGLFDLGMMQVIEDIAQGKTLSAIHHLDDNAPLKMQLLSIEERIRKGILVGRPMERNEAALRLGMSLWKEREKRISGAEHLVLSKLRSYAVRKKPAPEGIPPEPHLRRADLFPGRSA